MLCLTASYVAVLKHISYSSRSDCFMWPMLQASDFLPIFTSEIPKGLMVILVRRLHDAAASMQMAQPQGREGVALPLPHYCSENNIKHPAGSRQQAIS